MSCRTAQTETKSESRQEQVSEQSLDLQTCDLLRTLMVASANETDTDLLAWTLLTYDTSRPAVDSTGRPPLQSELRARRRHTRQRDTRLQAEQAETLATVVVAADRSEASQTEQEQRKTERRPILWERVVALLCLAWLALVAALGIIYIIKKRK